MNEVHDNHQHMSIFDVVKIGTLPRFLSAWKHFTAKQKMTRVTHIKLNICPTLCEIQAIKTVLVTSLTSNSFCIF